ncbi:MAG: ABC transporter permease subunit [Candidatus Caldarchaeum sp.]|nr:ABC transporter permease subunit [Candidatus Caldarchaeum sp.]
MNFVDVLLLSLLAIAASYARMTIALFFSVVFSLAVGIAAGTSKTFERIAIPVLDILQSIPILGFFPVAIQLFYTSIPVVGAELAAIFLIFTSQVWNITFAVYESTRFIQAELLDTAKFLRINLFERIRYLYIPSCLPRVVRNFQPSWANGMFFLVGSEILTFGQTEIQLFGLGTIVSQFAVEGNAVGIATALSLLIFTTVLINLMIFIPLNNIFEKPFRRPSRSWKRLGFLRKIAKSPKPHFHIPGITFSEYNKAVSEMVKKLTVLTSIIRNLIFFVIVGVSLAVLVTGGNEFFEKLYLAFQSIGLDVIASSAFFSFIRVMAAVGFSVAWSLPAAIAIARKQNLSATVSTVFQVIASIPVTIVYPLIAESLASQHEIRAFLMIIAATQWYVFFQVLAGLRNMPPMELEVADLLQLKTWDKIKMVYLPRATPALITGCITAAGGAWNGLIVAERLVLGDIVAETELPGLGKLLSQLTYAGDLLGSIAVIITMSSIIVLMNRLFWKRLYDTVASKLKIE